MKSISSAKVDCNLSRSFSNNLSLLPLSSLRSLMLIWIFLKRLSKSSEDSNSSRANPKVSSCCLYSWISLMRLSLLSLSTIISCTSSCFLAMVLANLLCSASNFWFSSLRLFNSCFNLSICFEMAGLLLIFWILVLISSICSWMIFKSACVFSKSFTTSNNAVWFFKSVLALANNSLISSTVWKSFFSMFLEMSISPSKIFNLSLTWWTAFKTWVPGKLLISSLKMALSNLRLSLLPEILLINKLL